MTGWLIVALLAGVIIGLVIALAVEAGRADRGHAMFDLVELTDMPVERANALADAVQLGRGWVRHDVRYEAARAAETVVRARLGDSV